VDVNGKYGKNNKFGKILFLCKTKLMWQRFLFSLIYNIATHDFSPLRRDLPEACLVYQAGRGSSVITNLRR
jgi:hypothetical protein